MVYKLDTYRAEANVEPFVLELSDGKTLTISAPTAEIMMQIGETPSFESRKLLKLLCGDSYDELWSAVSGDNHQVATSLVVDMVKHFKIGQGAHVPGGFGALPR